MDIDEEEDVEFALSEIAEEEVIEEASDEDTTNSWPENVEEATPFEAKGKVFERKVVKDSNFRVFIFQGVERLYIDGCVDARVVFGNVSCFGLQLTQSYQPIMSLDTHGLLFLESSTNSTFLDWAHRVVDPNTHHWNQEDESLQMNAFVQSLLSTGTQEIVNSISAILVLKSASWISRFAGITSGISKKPSGQDDIMRMSTCRLLSTLEKCQKPIFLHFSWKNAICHHQWTRTSFPSSILICGKKNVGKSTLLKYLTNVLLSKTDKVCLIDLDLGQPELTAPGIVSLNVLEGGGLVFPSFASQYMTKKHTLVEAHFAGVFSATEKLDFILSAAIQLFARYKHSQDTIFNLPDGSLAPLLINTHGWVEGPAYSMLLQLVSVIMPSLLIQIIPPGSQLLFQPPEVPSKQENSDLTHPKLITLEPGHRLRYHDPKSFESRQEQLYSTLSCGNSRIYRLPWSAFRIFIDSEIPLSQAMVVLNASIVALIVDHTEYSTIDEVAHVKNPSPADLALPRFLLASPPMISSYCVGIGLIVSIDMDSKAFHLSTTVDTCQLKDVNTLIKGHIEPPVSLLMKGAVPSSPYITGDNVGAEGTGSGTISVRHVVRSGSSQGSKGV